eukprot:4351521-Heterocapsa_arctica.AAC.1
MAHLRCDVMHSAPYGKHSSVSDPPKQHSEQEETRRQKQREEEAAGPREGRDTAAQLTPSPDPDAEARGIG